MRCSQSNNWHPKASMMNSFQTWKMLLGGCAKSDDHSSWIEISPYWSPLTQPIKFHNAHMITLLTSHYLSMNYSALSQADLWQDGPLCSHQDRAFPRPSPLRINPLIMPYFHPPLSKQTAPLSGTCRWGGGGTPTLVLSEMLWHLHLFKGTFENEDMWERRDKKGGKVHEGMRDLINYSPSCCSKPEDLLSSFEHKRRDFDEWSCWSFPMKADSNKGLSNTVSVDHTVQVPYCMTSESIDGQQHPLASFTIALFNEPVKLAWIIEIIGTWVWNWIGSSVNNKLTHSNQSVGWFMFVDCVFVVVA